MTENNEENMSYFVFNREDSSGTAVFFSFVKARFN